MSGYFSSDFTYESRVQGVLDFDTFCQRLTIVSYSSQLEVKKIEELECCIIVDAVYHIIDNSEKFYSDFESKIYIYIEDGLVQKVVSKFKVSSENLLYIIKATAKAVKDKLLGKL